MIKVSIEKTYIKEEIIIDPYIPIKIKLGNFYSWEDPTKYVRFGDFKTSMLEIGFSEESGKIQSIALIGVNVIKLNKNHNLNFDICEEGLVVFNVENFKDKRSTDLFSKISINTWETEIVLNFSESVATRFIQNGKIKFGLNEADELCCVAVSGLNNKEIKKLNTCFENMLENNHS